MENKILIKLIVPELDTSFDIFLPVNELIWKIKNLIIKSISDLTSIELDKNYDFNLINQDTSQTYSNNEILINTDIRNGTELLLLSKPKGT